jgi:hypothetical protein
VNAEEIAEFWARYQHHRSGGEQRKGQAMFNALHETAPVLADMIRGTGADPFYSDGNIPRFRKELGLDGDTS